MGLRDRLLQRLSGSGSGSEPIRAGEVVEAAVVQLAQSELVVSGLATEGIPASAVEERVMDSRLGHPMARILVRTEHLAAARQLIEELRA
jgi:hypothetical protein